MIYITGDTHGNFRRVLEFGAQHKEFTQNDIFIILGDAGFNYYGGLRDNAGKMLVSKLPFTVFCIHGNHEMRPFRIEGYKEVMWNGGTVYKQEGYPNILFAKDGEIFNLEGRKTITIGGAYSVDKHYRLTYGYHWFEDEQPSPQIKQAVKTRLDKENWQVDIVLSHTCPYKYIPREAFIEGIEQSTVDNSTEEWLDKIESNLQYEQWYCGHYHIGKRIDRLQFLFEEIIPPEEKRKKAQAAPSFSLVAVGRSLSFSRRKGTGHAGNGILFLQSSGFYRNP